MFSWLLAIGLATAAVALAYRVGTATTDLRAGDGHAKSKAVAAALGWAALGVMLFWLRWNAASLSGVSIDFDGAGDTEAALAQEREHLIAVVLAGIYIATGVVAWIDGQKLHNPLAKVFRIAHRKRRQLERHAAKHSGRVVRFRRHVEMARSQLEAIEGEREAALHELEKLGAELKDYARIRIAIALGDPASTGVVRTRADRTTAAQEQEGADLLVGLGSVRHTKRNPDGAHASSEALYE